MERESIWRARPFTEFSSVFEIKPFVLCEHNRHSHHQDDTDVRVAGAYFTPSQAAMDSFCIFHDGNVTKKLCKSYTI